MSFPPSKYSPEYYKPQKPENHSCCGGACGPSPTPEKPVVKRGCVVRYQVGNTTFHKVGNSTKYRTC